MAETRSAYNKTFPPKAPIVGGKTIILRELEQTEEVLFLDTANGSMVASAVGKTVDGLGTVRDRLLERLIVSYDGKECATDQDRQRVWQEALTTKARAALREWFDRLMAVDSEDPEWAAFLEA